MTLLPENQGSSQSGWGTEHHWTGMHKTCHVWRLHLELAETPDLGHVYEVASQAVNWKYGRPLISTGDWFQDPNAFQAHSSSRPSCRMD
jgi:hypothetical protein